MIYLASPYSHKDTKIQEARFNTACRVAGYLMNNGAIVFSPIAHSHPIAQIYGLPTNWEFWRNYDEKMLALCESVTVLTMDGWKESTGVQAEIKIAEGLGIPISYLDPAEIGIKNE